MNREWPGWRVVAYVIIAVDKRGQKMWAMKCSDDRGKVEAYRDTLARRHPRLRLAVAALRKLDL